MRRPKPDRSLLEIAIENVEEGCVRETYAAAVATWQATHAADSDVRAAMGSIARDERRHAALSWSVAAWLEGKLSGDERRQVHLARAGAIAALSESVESAWPNEMALKAGLPSAAEGRRLLAELRSSLWRD